MENNINVIKAVEEINYLNIEDTNTIQDLFNKFYDICRKYNIKRGVRMSTVEWSICMIQFQDKLKNYMQFSSFVLTPDDLLY